MSNMPDFPADANEPQQEPVGEGGAVATESSGIPGMDASPAMEAGPIGNAMPGFSVGPSAPGGMPGSSMPVKSEAPLFTGWQVGLASMLGTPMAGFVLLAMNLFRRNQAADGYVMFLPGLISLVAINVLPCFLPAEIEFQVILWLMVLPVSLFAMRQFSYDLFGTELIKQEEEKRGGSIAEISMVVVGMLVVSLGLQYLLYSQWNLGLFTLFMSPA